MCSRRRSCCRLHRFERCRLSKRMIAIRLASAGVSDAFSVDVGDKLPVRYLPEVLPPTGSASGRHNARHLAVYLDNLLALQFVGIDKCCVGQHSGSSGPAATMSTMIWLSWMATLLSFMRSPSGYVAMLTG